MTSPLVDEIADSIRSFPGFVCGEAYAEDIGEAALAALQEFAARGGVEAREVAALLFGADNVRVGVLLSPLPSRNPHVGMPWIVYHPDYCSSDNFTKDVLIIVPPNPTGDADG